MSRKRITAPKTTLKRAADDFKKIHGIGSVIETRLHDVGICTYRQLARLSAEAIAFLIPSLSVHQVTKQDWIGQAHKLTPVKTKSPHKKKKNIKTSRQHYENFTVEFLLDEKNKIHRMRAVHVQSGDVNTWATWNTGRLIDFLAWHSGTHLSYVKTAHPSITKTKPVFNQVEKPGQPVEVGEKASPPALKIIPIKDLETDTPYYKLLRTPASTTVTRQIHLLKWDTLLASTNQSLHSIPHDQPFDVRLVLDLANMHLNDILQLHSTVTLSAKKLGNGHQHALQKSETIVAYADTITLTVPSMVLSEGLYRLNACLTIIPMGTSAGKDIMKAFFPGGLFQIY